MPCPSSIAAASSPGAPSAASPTSRWASVPGGRRRAAEIAPDVRICLELHAGLAAYNPASFLQLAEVTGRNVGVNLDPSHFWWQGIDPLAVVEALGDRIGFAHAKDTTVYSDRVR